jgi:XTP/dITP diphosphohydrolase
MNKIILATRNKGKTREIKEILNGLPFIISDLIEENINLDIKEDGDTYHQNALIKARTIFEATNEMVISDDSGLEVDFLNKRPGMHSARYAGTTEERIKKLLNELEGVPFDKRRARFVCVSCFLIHIDEYYFFEGTIEGFISEKASGTNGFGFDPIFYLPDYNKTMAELPPELKNRISHRAKAFEKLRNFLVEKFIGNNH